jgi:hypothetical protein
MLKTDGFERVKRRQALRYFTWRWDWRRVLRGEQFRFLRRNSSAWDVVAAVARPNPVGRRVWEGVDWSMSERWLYITATRLLWRYAQRHGERAVLDLAEPELGSPLPVRLAGRLVSQDLANGALEMRTISRALAGHDPRHIVEVGGGYGRTAYVLLSLYPRARYTIVDIEPARSIAAWYLRTLFPDRVIDFVGPSNIDGVSAGADLVVSISSLQEMLPEEVARYLRWMDGLAGGGVVYLKQLQEWHNPVDDVTLRFDEYPVPARWVPLHDAPAPVQTNFTERAWRVPPAEGSAL